MAVTPNNIDRWSENVAKLYESLEGEIIRIIARRLKKGYEDITYWQAQKLQELRMFNTEVVRLLSKVTKIGESEIKRMFEEAGKGIVQDIDKAVPFPKKPMPSNLDAIIAGFFNQAWGDIDNLVNQTLITTHYGVGTAQRAYQGVLNQTAAMFNSGLYTFEQSLERAIMELAQKGIDSGLIDRGGHRWSLEGYVRNVLKSTLGNTYNTVRKDRLADYGIYTVVVTSHIGPRSACSKIQGNVVDLRRPEELPENWPYRSIYDPYWEADYGAPGGHRGVNCRHMHIPFIPGVSVNNQPKYDARLNERVREARDKQRRLERDIVKYKKNLMIAEALGSDSADYWRMMVRRKQKAMREHIERHSKYLSRNYAREKVYTPLDTMLKDFAYDN